LVSCNRDIEQKNLIGSWKRTNVDAHYPENYIDKITFTNDSVVFEEFEKEKLVTRISTAYKFNEDSNGIRYDAGNNRVDLIVSKLTDSEMELLNVHDKNPMKYIRVK